MFHRLLFQFAAALGLGGSAMASISTRAPSVEESYKRLASSIKTPSRVYRPSYTLSPNQRQIRKDARRAHAAGKRHAFG